jgi:hypothetical protein
MIRALAAAALVLASAHAAEAMDYSTYVHDGRMAIIAKGYIERGDADRFETFLKTMPHGWLGQTGNLVFFDSPGGYVAEGLAIGAVVERHHFMTGVGSRCTSACVLPWAAGERKYSFEGHCVGVHSAWLDEVATKAPKALAAEARKNLAGVTNLGMAEWFWDHGAPSIVTKKIFNTPPSDIYCLTDEDLAAWNVRVMP